MIINGKGGFKQGLMKKLSTSIVNKFVKCEDIAAYSVALPSLSSIYIERYKKWIKNNFNAKMDWMERNIGQRRGVDEKFPWAKSVIVVADNYYLDKERQPKALKISRYAWGDDYHKVLQKKLKHVLEKFKKFDNEINGRVYVDTGPILEKAYGIESGLGWMGKNSLIIVPGYGSYVFLGLIILNREIEGQRNKVTPQCGTCENCLNACPTGALEKPYVLNANKCISYFSIEKKDDFTKQEAAWLQDWLYGCDICLDACPWNKKWAHTTTDESYFNRIKLLERSPQEWKELTQEEFSQLFKKNVFKRLKFDRFRRNLLTAIENL